METQPNFNELNELLEDEDVKENLRNDPLIVLSRQAETRSKIFKVFNPLKQKLKSFVDSKIVKPFEERLYRNTSELREKLFEKCCSHLGLSEQTISNFKTEISQKSLLQLADSLSYHVNVRGTTMQKYLQLTIAQRFLKPEKDILEKQLREVIENELLKKLTAFKQNQKIPFSLSFVLREIERRFGFDISIEQSANEPFEKNVLKFAETAFNCHGINIIKELVKEHLDEPDDRMIIPGVWLP